MTDTPASERIGRHLLIVFGTVLVCYVVGFWGSEWWRHRRGPWEVTFTSGTNGLAGVEINQAALGIRGVRVEVAGAPLTNQAPRQVLHFREPTDRARVPFGQVTFLDTTVLPGTVTFDLFGHEVELLPRVLIIDKHEHPWRSGELHRRGFQAK
jgi:hypothetical protein